jgi:two-component SAPR family response regulator
MMTAGLVKRGQEELKDAIDHLEEALPYLKNKGAHRELATAYFHLADIYFSLKKKKVALDMLESCAEVVKELGYDHFLIVEARRNPLLVQYASANKAADGYYTRLLKLTKSSSTVKDGTDTEEAEDDSAATRAFGFGHTRVEISGREITDLEWRSEKSKEMFFFFLANRRPLRKEEIVTAMWPDAPEEKTTSAFHSNMYRLRQALYKDVIAKDSGRYVLDPREKFAFDVEAYQVALTKVDEVKGTPEAIPHLEKALALYKGQFAPDLYSEWVENLRWQLEEQHMSMLAQLAAAYSEAGEYKKSADICQKILDVDDLNEAAWYRLMASYVQSGQTEAAKYSFNRYVQILSKEDLDEEDVPSFDDLVREIKAGQLRV